MLPVLLFGFLAIGVMGLAMMLIAFALIFQGGGWNKSITEPSRRGEWPAARLLMLLGATCGAVFSLGIGLLVALDKWPWQ